MISKLIIFKISRNIKILTLVLLFVLTPTLVNAATLSLTPSTSNINVGNIVSVKININTQGKYINNAEAILQFPLDLLEVISITKSPSIFSLWVENPEYSNTKGTVSFNGGVANPGYNGSTGTVASVTFRAKKQGTASLLFSDAAIRENDGLGTDILSGRGTSVIQIVDTKEEPQPTPPPATVKTNTPPKPIVTSVTHPDQNLWYSDNTASFSWKTPTGVTSIQAFTNRIPDSIPTTSYDNSVTQKTLTELPDGTFYFHIRYANSNGFGPITNFKIKVDTKAPEPFIPTIRTENNQSIINLNAEDSTSGIDYYTLKIDDNQVLTVKKSDLKDSEYVLPVLIQGDHSISIIAYDGAGNSTQSDTSFTSSFITTPVISLSSSEIKKGESVVIFGKSDYPNKQTEIVLELSGVEIKKYITTISSDGSFSLTADNIRKVGLINVSARNILSESVKSQPSEKVQLNVLKVDIAKITITIFWIISAIILVLLLIIFLYVGWYKFLSLKKRNRSALQRATEDAHRAVSLLKEELNDQLAELQKISVGRDLSKNEEIIFKDIQKDIDDVDKFIQKKLKKLL